MQIDDAMSLLAQPYKGMGALHWKVMSLDRDRERNCIAVEYEAHNLDSGEKKSVAVKFSEATISCITSPAEFCSWINHTLKNAYKSEDCIPLGSPLRSKDEVAKIFQQLRIIGDVQFACRSVVFDTNGLAVTTTWFAAGKSPGNRLQFSVAFPLDRLLMWGDGRLEVYIQDTLASYYAKSVGLSKPATDVPYKWENRLFTLTIHVGGSVYYLNRASAEHGGRDEQALLEYRTTHLEYVDGVVEEVGKVINVCVKLEHLRSCQSDDEMHNVIASHIQSMAIRYSSGKKFEIAPAALMINKTVSVSPKQKRRLIL